MVLVDNFAKNNNDVGIIILHIDVEKIFFALKISPAIQKKGPVNMTLKRALIFKALAELFLENF